MILKQLSLEHFRNHKKRNFQFDTTTIIVGKNTAGKTNILEAIYFLSTGKSFRAEKEVDTIQEDETFAKVSAKIEGETGDKELSIIFSTQKGFFSKKFMVNNVARRQLDFVSNFYSVLFTPSDIDIISSSPGLRRKFIDSILLQTSRDYRRALLIYEKSLRNRNKMLYDTREGKKRYRSEDFEYWDNILIENGSVITEHREEFVAFVNASKKDIFDFEMVYDKSTITPERLEKYYHEERAAGVTLVGPQRDDFFFFFSNTKKHIKEFGSRGEQRLTLLQVKVYEIEYLKNATGEMPTLLLDDIFSELDAQNIDKVFHLIPTQQTIITTTHKEFIPEKMFGNSKISVIEL